MEGVEHGMGAWLVRGPAGDPSLTPNIQATDACLFAPQVPLMLQVLKFLTRHQSRGFEKGPTRPQ